MSRACLDRPRSLLPASSNARPTIEDQLIDVGLTGPPTAPAPREDFLRAARLVGDRLAQLAFSTGSDASWIGVTPLSEQRWALAPLGIDLYGGVPGIALFLARLSCVTGDSRSRDLAEKATFSFVRQLESWSGWPRVGAFAGWGGAIYALTHLGLLLRDRALVDRAAGLVSRLRAWVPADEQFDLTGGSAGAIMGLAALHAVTGSPAALIAIRAAADHLVEHAQPVGDGVNWRTPSPAGAPLVVGCSHDTAGIGGIALSLLTASALTCESRFERVARAAMAYERSTFSQDWWCHGAPGIGLARLAGLRHADDSNVRRDIALAVSATRRRGFGRNHSLCDGDLGSLEFLSCAAARLGEPGHASSVGCFAAGILRSIRERGWQCGVPAHVETPGLMIGLAGIGDGLLRIAEPRLPSILMLQPP
jgi:type 2 lantibiotic biosynthesis protein LanM